MELANRSSNQVSTRVCWDVWGKVWVRAQVWGKAVAWLAVVSAANCATDVAVGFCKAKKLAVADSAADLAEVFVAAVVAWPPAVACLTDSLNPAVRVRLRRMPTLTTRLVLRATS